MGEAGKPQRVVVVDDNRDMVATMTGLLRLQGYETKGCYDAMDIVACIREFDPEVVILDLAMPGKTGLDAAREIRASIPGKRPVLIALTAEPDTDENRKAARALGFDYYIAKAGDPEILTRLLKSLRGER